MKDDGSTGTINISINSNRRLIMELIEKFKKDYPAVNIKTEYFGNPEEEDYNIIIDGENANLKGFLKETLFSEDIALAVNSESPLAYAEKINISELEKEPFITMDDKASMNKVTREICQSCGFEPRIALQSDDPIFVRKCVELGLGIAFAPTLSWKGQFGGGVVLKEIDYKRDIFLYVNEKNSFSICVQNFIKRIIEEIKSLNK